jgi:hypothetical protein
MKIIPDWKGRSYRPYPGPALTKSMWSLALVCSLALLWDNMSDQNNVRVRQWIYLQSGPPKGPFQYNILLSAEHLMKYMSSWQPASENILRQTQEKHTQPTTQTHFRQQVNKNIRKFVLEPFLWAHQEVWALLISTYKRNNHNNHNK